MKLLKNKIKTLLTTVLSRDLLLSSKAHSTDPSQFGESKILELILQCATKTGIQVPKTFLELGANAPYQLSCSWYLEKTAGFSGVSIDPLSDSFSPFSRYRPNTQFINKAFVPLSYKSDKIRFYKSSCHVLSTCDHEEALVSQQMGHKLDVIDVDTLKLDELFPLFDDHIGVLILDIESVPLQIDILHDIINSSLSPMLICVETLEFSTSINLRTEYDKILCNQYDFVAGTYLNSIYLANSLSGVN